MTERMTTLRCGRSITKKRYDHIHDELTDSSTMFLKSDQQGYRHVKAEREAQGGGAGGGGAFLPEAHF